MRVTVTHTLGDLQRDLERIPVKFIKEGNKVVKRNVREGNALARGYAKASSGPHGKNYHKRLTAEMTGALSGEYGPHGAVAGRAVGASWRSGPPNTDLPRSADIQGPKLAKDVRAMIDGLFW